MTYHKEFYIWPYTDFDINMYSYFVLTFTLVKQKVAPNIHRARVIGFLLVKIPEFRLSSHFTSTGKSYYITDLLGNYPLINNQ